MHEVFLYEHRQKRKLVCGLIWSGHIHVHSFLVDARMNTESVDEVQKRKQIHITAKLMMISYLVLFSYY